MTAGVKVELGLAAQSGVFIWDSSLLDGGDVWGDALGFTWTDVSAWTDDRTVRAVRGASADAGPFWRCDAGDAGFELDNHAGEWDPLNEASPWVSGGVSQLRANVPVRVSVIAGDTTVPVFTGRTRDWPINNPKGIDSAVQVAVDDAVARLQAANLEAITAVGAGDTAVERIGRILDRIGWDTNERDLQDSGTAKNTMQATTMAQPAWTEMLLTADSDPGYLWINRFDHPVYRSTRSMPAAAAVTFSGTSDADDETYAMGEYYETAVPSLDVEKVYNVAKIARTGGIEQTVQDAVSVQPGENGIRAYQRSDLICETDSMSRRVAQWIIYQRAQLRTRIERITVRVPPGDTATLNQRRITLASLDIGDRVRVVHPSRYGTVIDRQGFVRGLDWSFGLGGAIDLAIELAAVPIDQQIFKWDDSLLDGGLVLTF